MKKQFNRQTLLILFVMILLAECAYAQFSPPQRMWVFFHDKSASALQSSHTPALGISDRALKRRAKSLPPDRLIDELDLPVSETAIAQIKQTGVKIRTVSRWFNAVTVEGTSNQIQALKTLPLVSRLEPVVRFKRSKPLQSHIITHSTLEKSSCTSTLDYGPSITQLANIKVTDLHTLGVNGAGVLIGMLDNGFNNFQTHAALKNTIVLADSDFIHNISDVNRQPWENLTQGDHGTGTLSLIGGFDNGQLIGAAYGASFLLAKTEMDSSGSVDFHSEEDTYVAALEWMERLGVDITSSSLGYKNFLTPPFYTYANLNGRTTKVAQGAIIAARKGVLVVTAMGNEGSMPSGFYKDSTLVSPADADSVLAVGATTSGSKLAAFSGCGPAADGRIKPEVVAQGEEIYWAYGGSTNGYTSGVSGTSCSTPLAAGAAALVLSVHPNWSAMQVRQALLNIAVHINDGTQQSAVYPNNYYGYGLVNALEAALSDGIIFSNRPLIRTNDTAYVVSTKTKSKIALTADSLFLFYKKTSAGLFERVALVATGTADEYAAHVLKTNIDSTSIGYFSARDNSGSTRTNPYNAPQETFSLKLTNGTVDVASHVYRFLPKEFRLSNYPNPFNPSTTLLIKIPQTEEAEIAIFNILGQQMKIIFKGVLHAGEQRFQWDGTDEHNLSVAAGMYIARLKTNSHILSTKLILLK